MLLKPNGFTEPTVIKDFLTIEFLGTWEIIHNPNFKVVEFDHFRRNAGLLFDPTLVNYLNISEDPIPTFRKLMKEYSSGYYKVPSVGAGTANTEFESITGMSMHYFGPGEYPYKSID